MDIAPQGWVAIGVATGCMTLAVMAVALRFVARKKKEMRYEIDDWITLLALVRETHICAGKRDQ